MSIWNAALGTGVFDGWNCNTDRSVRTATRVLHLSIEGSELSNTETTIETEECSICHPWRQSTHLSVDASEFSNTSMY